MKRAADVFASFDKANMLQFVTLYDETLKKLEELGSLGQTVSIPNAAEDTFLAKATVLWTKGDFSQAQELCESIITEYPTSNLHMF
jgi:hypothetical protein